MSAQPLHDPAQMSRPRVVAGQQLEYPDLDWPPLMNDDLEMMRPVYPVHVCRACRFSAFQQHTVPRSTLETITPGSAIMFRGIIEAGHTTGWSVPDERGNLGANEPSELVATPSEIEQSHHETGSDAPARNSLASVMVGTGKLNYAVTGAAIGSAIGTALVLVGTFFESNIVLFVGLCLFSAAALTWVITFGWMMAITIRDVRRLGWGWDWFKRSSYTADERTNVPHEQDS